MKYIVEICVYIDVAILSIAYPIIIDKISNIGEKYNSEYLSNVFDQKFPQTKTIFRVSYFQLILILTLISFIFKILNLPAIECLQNIYLIEKSADIIIFLLTIALTVSFIIWLNRIMLFRSKTSKLVLHLVNTYENKKEDKNQSKTYYLKTINELTIHSIRNQDPHIGETLINFYYNQFMKFRKDNKDTEGTIYPFDLYYITNEIITTSIDSNDRKFSKLGYMASSGIFLLGENFTYSTISKETYRWLWRNILASSNHKKSISNYWSTASQHLQFSLARIAPEFEAASTKVANIEEIEKIEKERKKFLELNYALGGLLFYLSNYDILNYILTFSQSSPPRYELLPSTMDEIFEWFEHFANIYRNLEDPIEYRYYFPDIDNLGTSNQIKHNICLYISLLFIRQFTLQRNYHFQDFKTFHSLSLDLGVLHSYKNYLQYFRKCIESVLKNEKLLSAVNYNISQDDVLKVFDSLESQITKQIDITKLQTEISTEKVKQFETTTGAIIKSTFEAYDIIKNNTNFRKTDKTILSSIQGIWTLAYKSSFTTNDIPNINFDSVYAESIANTKIKYFLPNSFLLARTRRYLVDKNNVIKAFEKLIPRISQDYIIVSLCSDYKVQQLISDSDYKNIIVKIPYTNNHLSDTFFLLKKKNLPKIEFKDLQKKDIDKYNLKLLEEDIKLYSSVIDINTPENRNLQEEYQDNDNDELKVLIFISFICIINWREDRDIVMLSLSTPFIERGIENEISEIKKLK